MTIERCSIFEAAEKYPNNWVLLVDMTICDDGCKRGEVYAIENSYDEVMDKVELIGSSRGAIGLVEGNNINPIRLGGGFLQ